MATINKQRAQYFDWHPTVNSFFFTSDDTAFGPTQRSAADNHAANLKDKTVDTVTRAEATAWKAANAPLELEQAEKEYTAAQEDLTAAQAAVDGLAAKATAKQKGPVMKALNIATARLANAKLAVDAAKEAMPG